MRFNNVIIPMQGLFLKIKTSNNRYSSPNSEKQKEEYRFLDLVLSAIKHLTTMLCSPALKCSPGSHYNSCAPACRQPTCQDPAGPGGSCNHPCVEGCVCDTGLILSGDKCVPISECGCTDEDDKYRPVSRVRWEEE